MKFKFNLGINFDFRDNFAWTFQSNRLYITIHNFMLINFLPLEPINTYFDLFIYKSTCRIVDII